MESKDSAQPPNYFLSPDMLSITSIRLNGSNYAQWAQVVEVFLLGRKKFNYVLKEPTIPTDLKFVIMVLQGKITQTQGEIILMKIINPLQIVNTRVKFLGLFLNKFSSW